MAFLFGHAFQVIIDIAYVKQIYGLLEEHPKWREEELYDYIMGGTTQLLWENFWNVVLFVPLGIWLSLNLMISSTTRLERE